MHQMAIIGLLRDGSNVPIMAVGVERNSLVVALENFVCSLHHEKYVLLGK